MTVATTDAVHSQREELVSRAVLKPSDAVFLGDSDVLVCLGWGALRLGHCRKKCYNSEEKRLHLFPPREDEPIAFEHDTTAMADAGPRGLLADDMGVPGVQPGLDLTLFNACQRPIYVES